MSLLPSLLTAAGILLPSPGQEPPAAPTHVVRAQIVECVKPVPIVSAGDHRASCQVRTGPGEVELHVKETDIFYILDGAATLVTGGTIVGRAQGANPNQIKGTAIEGGDVRALAKGDVIVIPAGVPHWFKEVRPSINILSIKVIKP